MSRIEPLSRIETETLPPRVRAYIEALEDVAASANLIALFGADIKRLSNLAVELDRLNLPVAK